MDIYNKVKQFTKSLEMHSDFIDIERDSDSFKDQMIKSLEKEGGSSLKMLPTYLTADGEIPINESVIVVDAGGTNFRVAAVHFDEQYKIVEEYFEQYKMPGIEKAITMDEFYQIAADRLMPAIDKSDKIAFCFSYAAEILENKDGRVIDLAKEVTISQSSGKLICEGIKQELIKRGKTGKSFILINDTVSTMIGGKVMNMNMQFETYIGMILGTGSNTCYIEKTKNINKINKNISLPENIAVNIESGYYDGVHQGVIDKQRDARSKNPGVAKYEKMIAGAYQGMNIYRTVEKATEQGLFSNEFVERFKDVEPFTLKEVDDFCFAPTRENKLAMLTAGSNSDRQTLYYIIDSDYERAAKLATFVIAGILKQTGYGTDPTMPVCICADGTTFYKSKLFRGKFNYYIKDYIEHDMRRYVEFVKAEKATLIGTAVAGLLNC